MALVYVIEQDEYGLFLKGGKDFYRPVASLCAPGRNVYVMHKMRSVEPSLFREGYTPGVMWHRDGDDKYAVLHKKQPEFGMAGRRELWCHHRDGWSPLDVPSQGLFGIKNVEVSQLDLFLAKHNLQGRRSPKL